VRRSPHLSTFGSFPTIRSLTLLGSSSSPSPPSLPRPAVADEDTPAPAAYAGDTAPVRRHLLTDIPEANDDIDTVHIFPDYLEVWPSPPYP